MSPLDDANSTETFSIDRRDALKLAGGAIGVGALGGTATGSSAQPEEGPSSQFIGCSAICGGTDEDAAVVMTNDGYECRRLDKDDEELAVPQEEAPDIAVPAEVYACYEAADDEAIVAVLHHEGGEESEERICGLCLNPNACADEYRGSKEEIIAELECGRCNEIRTECVGNVYDSNGELTNEAETTEGD